VLLVQWRAVSPLKSDFSVKSPSHRRGFPFRTRAALFMSPFGKTLPGVGDLLLLRYPPLFGRARSSWLPLSWETVFSQLPPPLRREALGGGAWPKRRVFFFPPTTPGKTGGLPSASFPEMSSLVPEKSTPFFFTRIPRDTRPPTSKMLDFSSQSPKD